MACGGVVGAGAAHDASATLGRPSSPPNRPTEIVAKSASRYVSRERLASMGSSCPAALRSRGGASLPLRRANAICPRSRSRVAR